MPSYSLLTGFVLFVLLLNLPLGYLRQGCEKFSPWWFFYIHIWIPFVIYVRISSGISWKFIPFSLAAGIAGQFIGGAMRRRVPQS